MTAELLRDVVNASTPYSTWEAAQQRALFLAKATGWVHQVKGVPPTPDWPWHRWRVRQTHAPVAARRALRMVGFKGVSSVLL